MMIWRALLLVSILLAGCVQLPLTPHDIQARKFESVPDKAVIYLVRNHPDFSDQAATIWLGDTVMITTYPGTYFRWEATPGTHRITGYGPDIGTIMLQVEPGRIYFVEQQLTSFMQFPRSQFFLVNEPYGRAAVSRAVLVGGQ